jgi:hypothetical protein
MKKSKFAQYHNHKEELKMKKATYAKSLTIAMRQEAYDSIKEITDQNQTSMGTWVRSALDQALTEKTKKGGQTHDRK